MKFTEIASAPDYEISRCGVVRSKITGRKMSVFKDEKKSHGYWKVALGRSRKCQRIYTLHRLLAVTFLPNPKKLPQVNHRDADKDNNTLPNLEWVTPLQNMRHAVKMGLTQAKKGAASHSSKLTLRQVRWVRRTWPKLSQSKIAFKLGVSRGCIQAIVNGKSWVIA